MSLADHKAAKRVFHGLMPEFYDQVLYGYPNPTTVELTLSHKDEDTGTNYVTAIIQMIFTDASQEYLSVVKRIL